ncbi:hypothetical protein [Promicromonospora sp. NPDC023987]|uniref:hypothetical protein n=1 Tax=Promicromonospora sp. NPDC023987 TaxID=3155360 RepID=UPI0033E9DDAC
MRSNTVQRVLVIALLALTGVLGVAASGPATPAAAVAALPAVEPVTWPDAATHVTTDDAGSHTHDTISLLCLCAIVAVAALLVTGRGVPLRRQSRRLKMATLPSRVPRYCSPVSLASPLSWGVCQR